MAHEKVTGIVTHYVNYKDNDRILTLFSRERGRIDARARGCRRPKSPLLACAQPFVYGEFLLFMGKSRSSVDQCDVLETFHPLREDLARLTAASAMLAFAQQAIQPDQPNEPLFTLLYHALSYLAYGDIDPVDGALCFCARYFDAIGLRPSVTACAICQKPLLKAHSVLFSPASGGAVCPSCGQGGVSISALSAEALRRMLMLDDTSMRRVKLPNAARRELYNALADYAAYHLEYENKPFQALKPFINTNVKP